MDQVLYGWPYLGLVLAAAVLGWLFTEKRAPGAPRRLDDPTFLLPLLAPMYLVHQFEEHGIDALGRHYSFLPELCATLGYPDLATCPGDANFIFAVNVAGCWFTFALPLVFRRRNPLLAASAWGVAVINALTHIGSAVAHQAYNPGVLTSVALFVPLSVLMVRSLRVSGAVPRGQLWRIPACGAALHLVLLGSLIGRIHGLPYPLFLLVNALNGAMPLPFGRGAAPPAPAPAA